MSYESKGKFEVIRILRNSILKGLAAYGVDGFECMEFAQPLIQSANNVVLIRQDGQKRVGWQRVRYESEDGIFYKRESWIEEQDWTLVVVSRRPAEKVSSDTLTPGDVAASLISWFSDRNGIMSLRKHDCAPLFPSMSDMKPYKDDSQTYQYTSSFKLVLQVPKTVRMKQDTAVPKCDGIEGV